MTDFDHDCLQKKKLAGQAKYRKCGSKSKKCNLPSDRMTQKQWKERCGPIVSFNLNRPMTWDNFKELPSMVQAEYIITLQKKYGATAADLGDMFGVRALTVRKHADANNLGVSFPRGHSMSAARRDEWNGFLGLTTRIEETHVEDPVTETVADEHLTTPIQSGIPISVEPKAMNMKRFSLKFSGVIDVNMIANSLKLILGNQSSGELEITCNLD